MSPYFPGDTQSCSYSYDDLGRSASVGCGAKGSQSFTYDPFGNLSKTANGVGLSFQPTSYNGANQPVGVGMTFDGNGNATKDNQGALYTWDKNFGNPASINGVNLIYDAQGQMVEQQNGSTDTQMLYSQVGKTAIMNGQALKSTGLSDAGPVFIRLPGGATAIYNSSGTLANFRHADWLGSSHLTTTASGTVASTSAYAPFGEQYTTSGTTDGGWPRSQTSMRVPPAPRFWGPGKEDSHLTAVRFTIGGILNGAEKAREVGNCPSGYGGWPRWRSYVSGFPVGEKIQRIYCPQGF